MNDGDYFQKEKDNARIVPQETLDEMQDKKGTVVVVVMSHV